MSSISIAGNTSGSVTLSAQDVSGSTTLTLPTTSGTVLTTASGQALTSPTITGTPTVAGQNFGPYTMKNRIINGAMVIDQRNAGAAVTLTSSAPYTVDRWLGLEDTDGGMTAQQDSSAPAGFNNSLKFTTTSADSSLSAAQSCRMLQHIEGYNVADLNWGTANAKTVTLSFWVRSSLTGTFAGGLRNYIADRGYPFNYTISAANTWEYKTVTVTGDTTGTWNTTNSGGISVIFDLGSGSNYQSTVNTWGSGNYFSTSGAQSVIGTNGATWYITGIQLEVGSYATPFEWRPYGMELALCQRYYEVSPSIITAYAQSSTAGKIIGQFQVTKRASPSVALYPNAGFEAQVPGQTFASGNNQTMGTISITTYSYGMSVSNYAFDYTNGTTTSGITGMTYIFNPQTVGAPLLTFNSEL